MKKKIGFIDLFIDEWHANNYPAWFRSVSRADDFELVYGWEEYPREGGKNLAQYCEQFNMIPLDSIDELVSKSDAICVLAPSRPDVHERLAEKALMSGKAVYIDKPFAPDKASAERMFKLAKKHGTALMSSSALRYGDELIALKSELNEKVVSVGTNGGGGSFEEYGIHQLEMIVSVLGIGAKRVICAGNASNLHLMIAYPDLRHAYLTYHPGLPFSVTLCSEKDSRQTPVGEHMFDNLLASVLDFFATGKTEINPLETIEIATLLDAGIKAKKTPYQWIDIDSQS